MKNMRFVDYLEKFRPGEPIKDVKGWIDAMARSYTIQIVREIRIVCGNSVLRLERYGKTLEECVNNLVIEYEEVIKSYLLAEIWPWITQYSQDHLEDDVLYLYDSILDENGERVSPVGILPDPYDDSDESLIQMNSSDDEIIENPITSEEWEHFRSFVDEDENKFVDWLGMWLDSLTEKEMIDSGFYYDIANPLKDEARKKQVMSLLEAIYNKVKEAKNEVLDLMKWHQFQQSGQSLADFADAIAPVIDGRIFEEHLDGSTLEAIFKGELVDGLTLMSSKKTLLVHVIKILYMDGPAECRVREWRDKVLKTLHLEGQRKNRWYDQLGEESGLVLQDVGEIIKKLTGVDKLKYEQDRRK